MLDGLTSAIARQSRIDREGRKERTSVHDLVDFVEVGETGDDRQRDLSEDGLWDRPDLLVDVVERAAALSSAPRRTKTRRPKRTPCP